MSTKTKDAILTPLVAEGLRLIAEAEEIKKERDVIAARLKDKDAELAAINDQLIAMGAGRYRDEADHLALVIAAIEPQLAPDTFRLKPTDLDAARELSGDAFKKLFDRAEVFSPKSGFDAIAGAVLTPAKARDLIALTIVPGTLTGGRRAYVRWK